MKGGGAQGSGAGGHEKGALEFTRRGGVGRDLDSREKLGGVEGAERGCVAGGARGTEDDESQRGVHVCDKVSQQETEVVRWRRVRCTLPVGQPTPSVFPRGTEGTPSAQVAFAPLCSRPNTITPRRSLDPSRTSAFATRVVHSSRPSGWSIRKHRHTTRATHHVLISCWGDGCSAPRSGLRGPRGASPGGGRLGPPNPRGVLLQEDA